MQPLAKEEEANDKKRSVLIDGIGLRIVMSKDIDGAYLAAMKEYGCKIEDILAVFCHAPFRASK